MAIRSKTSTRKSAGGKAGTASSSGKSGASTGGSSEVQRLEALLKLMNQYSLGELELEDERGRVFARKLGAGPVSYASAEMVRPNMAVTAAQAHIPAPAGAADSAASAVAAGKTAPAPGNDRQKKILSPFVGTFYRAGGPNAEPYVKEGQTVKKGQTLCIIEAMKLMNEIESDFNGKVISVLVENGQPVEFGEPLFLIET